MPRLQQLHCSVVLGRSDTALPEYRIKYHDGAVECCIASPDLDINFSILLQAHSYISPGLAVFVFIDGTYQCNRNVAASTDGTAELRLRQKEEKLHDGSFIGREWTFTKLGRARSGSERDKQFEENVGKIEVVVQRCCYDSSAAKAEIEKPASVKSAKKSPSVAGSGLFGGLGMGLFDGGDDIPQIDGASEWNTGGYRQDHTPLHGSWAGDNPLHGVYRPHEGLYKGHMGLGEMYGRDNGYRQPEQPRPPRYDRHAGREYGRRRHSRVREHEQDSSAGLADRILGMPSDLVEALLSGRKVTGNRTRDSSSDSSTESSSDSSSSSSSSSDETTRPASVKHKSRKKQQKKEKNKKKHSKNKKRDKKKKRDRNGSQASATSDAKQDGDKWGNAGGMPGSWGDDNAEKDQPNNDTEWAANNQQDDDAAQPDDNDNAGWGGNAAEGWTDKNQDWSGNDQGQAKPEADNAGWGGDMKSRSSKRSHSHDGGSSTSSYSSPDTVRAKPYWSDWNKSATAKLAATSRQPAHAALRSPYQYAAPAGPTVSTKSKTTADRGVQAGKGAAYEHQLNRPIYLDTMESPYAVFTFKYSSRSKLEDVLGRKIKKEMDAVVEEAERDQMLGMTKEQMVEELLKLRKQHKHADSNDAGTEAASSRSVSGQSSRSVKAKSNAGWGAQSTKSKASTKGFVQAPQAADSAPVW